MPDVRRLGSDLSSEALEPQRRISKISNGWVQHAFSAYGRLAALIADGLRSADQILAASKERFATPGEEAAFIQGLFKGGVAEVSVWRDYFGSIDDRMLSRSDGLIA